MDSNGSGKKKKAPRRECSSTQVSVQRTDANLEHQANEKWCAGIPRWVYIVGLLGAKTDIPIKLEILR
jgi:hypothetical protein